LTFFILLEFFSGFEFGHEEKGRKKKELYEESIVPRSRLGLKEAWLIVKNPLKLTVE